jgi:protein-S-isoprenylcysteine O-methyltransferase Ste14
MHPVHRAFLSAVLVLLGVTAVLIPVVLVTHPSQDVVAAIYFVTLVVATGVGAFRLPTAHGGRDVRPRGQTSGAPRLDD